MKKKAFVLSLISLLTLTACEVIFESTFSRSLDVYDLNKPYEEAKLNNQIKAYFIEEEELVPYLSVNDFDRLYKPYYKASVSTDIVNSKYQTTWTFYEEQSLVAYVNIDLTYQSIEVAGSLSDLFKDSSSSTIQNSTLSLGMKNDTFVNRRGGAIKNLSFRYYDFDTFFIDKENKYPLGLLNAVLRQESLPGIFFDYKSLYLYPDDSLLTSKNNIDGAEKSVFDLAQDNVAGLVMPEYLRRYNREVLLFNMDNYYGLASTRGIKSMRSHILNSNNADMLLSANAAERGQALFDLVQELSDGHTSLMAMSTIWDEKVTDTTLCKLWEERVNLRSSLYSDRLVHLLQKAEAEMSEEDKEAGVVPTIGNMYEPEYSNDGKVAKVYFDSFEIAYDAFDDDGNLKPEAYTKDTFLQLAEQFKAIKEKGGVEKVIIDISINGGGIVATLMKVLSLISKDNSSHVSFYREDYDSVFSYYTNVDSNLDGNYNLDDVYGDDFEIYMLTSPFSFSCGNAYPFLAQKEGLATIIGQKSGGGECAVGSFLLPNGQIIRISSMNHIGYAERNSDLFIGDECGAAPDITIPYKTYFDIEELQKNITPQEVNA